MTRHIKQTRAIIGAFAFAIALGASVSASAQVDTTGVDYLANLKACQVITDDAQRLACFDQAVGTVIAASDEGDVQIIDRETVRETRRGLFGFSIPKIKLFGGAASEDDELFESVVTKVSTGGRGVVLITIEDANAVWRVPNAKRRVFRTKPGDKVVFKKASLGTYFLRINGQTGVKGRRVQ